MSIITIVSSVTANGGIGVGNRLVYSTPEDLKYFKKRTVHKDLLMGRNTFESIGNLLQHRTSYVITTDRLLLRNKHKERNLIFVDKTPAEFIYDFRCKDDGRELIVIGGESVFNDAIPHVDKVNLTFFNIIRNADKFFPSLPSNFVLTSKQVVDPEVTRFFYSRVN